MYVCVKVFDDSKMINQMMSQPVVSTDTIDDDDELQQELDDLLAAKVDLPSAPLRPTTETFGNHRLLLIACGYCCFSIFFGNVIFQFVGHRYMFFSHDISLFCYLITGAQ